MSPKIFEKLKNKLNSLKSDLLKKIKARKTPPDFGRDVDPDEGTEESEMYGNELSVMQTYKNQLADIDHALKKGKKYGICENCCKEISENLLIVDPESRFCQKCKKKLNKK